MTDLKKVSKILRQTFFNIYINCIGNKKIFKIKFLLQREEQDYRNNFNPTNSHASEIK